MPEDGPVDAEEPGVEGDDGGEAAPLQTRLHHRPAPEAVAHQPDLVHLQPSLQWQQSRSLVSPVWHFGNLPGSEIQLRLVGWKRLAAVEGFQDGKGILHFRHALFELVQKLALETGPKAQAMDLTLALTSAKSA